MHAAEPLCGWDGEIGIHCAAAIPRSKLEQVLKNYSTCACGCVFFTIPREEAFISHGIME